jgi:hypothetical protein
MGVNGLEKCTVAVEQWVGGVWLFANREKAAVANRKWRWQSTVVRSVEMRSTCICGKTINRKR